MTEWTKGEAIERRDADGDLGGTMRLGGKDANIAPGTLLEQIYQSNTLRERHRHRYEFNGQYQAHLAEAGLIFSATSIELDLVEAIELADHPWYIGCQFHPEKSGKKGLELISSFLKLVI